MKPHLSGISYLLRPGELFALADHVCEPVCSSIEIEDETERCVGHFFDAIAGHVADGNAQLAGRFHVDVVNAAAYADDDTERFELLEILLCENYCVPHQSADGFV